MELYLPPPPPPPKNDGRFKKGHVPANKGKKWDDFMSKKGQRKARKGWKNCEIGHAFGRKRPDNAGRCRKAVVGIDDEGRLRFFDYIGSAAAFIGGSRENVGRCCRDNASGKVLTTSKGKGRGKGSPPVNTDHRYLGMRFYFETDVEIWKGKIKREVR